MSEGQAQVLGPDALHHLLSNCVEAERDAPVTRVWIEPGGFHFAQLHQLSSVPVHDGFALQPWSHRQALGLCQFVLLLGHLPIRFALVGVRLDLDTACNETFV